MAYQRDDIERVRAATDLAQLVEEVTTVRRRGRSVTAICPFHQEKTPSLSIDAGRGLWYCFGCQASGDVFRFVQETQGIGFTEALELLARRAGITLRTDPQAARRRGEREALVEAVEEAARFYHRRLVQAEDAGKARAYLRGRGYETDTVEEFGLGWAPTEWDVLVSHLRKDGVPERTIVAAGLGTESRRGRVIDRFRGRILFPIRDLRGDAVGFGGRLLEGDGPKYLNSPETPLYAKSRLLYGLDRAKSAIVSGGYVIVVEGYTDVIALHQAGLPVAVATCGTALGEGHFDLLRRFTERVVLAFDADPAGTGASLRGFEVSVPGDLDLRMAVLATGKDPADLVQAGEVEELRAAVEEAAPLLRFRLEQELARFDLDEPEGRGRAVRAAAAVVARHPDALVRQEYAAFLSRRTGVDPQAVARAVEGAVEAGRPRARPAEPARRLTGQERAEQELLRLLLANDEGIRVAEVEEDLLTVPAHREAVRLLAPALEGLAPGEAPDLGSLLGDDPSPTGALLRELALDLRPLSDAGEVLARLRGWSFERRIDGLRRDLAGLDADRDRSVYSARLDELLALEAAKRELGGAIGR